MSKKPVPSKKQAVSSTRSRHGAYVRGKRVKLQNKVTLEDCKKCGAKKRFHFACEECGYYGERQVFSPKEKGTAPRRRLPASHRLGLARRAQVQDKRSIHPSFQRGLHGHRWSHRVREPRVPGLSGRRRKEVGPLY